MITCLVSLQGVVLEFKMKGWTLGIGLWFLVTTAIAEPVLDISAGQKKSAPCAACHGVDGNSTVAAWPNIAGQSVGYLMDQLKDYREGQKGERFNPVMYSQVQALTDQDIEDLAKYYSSQKPSLGAAKPETLELGEKLYRGGNPATGVPACSACHSPEGDGNSPAGFPRLSGQHPDYIMDQLKKFKTGERFNDANGIMRDIAKRMTNEEMQAVSNYVSGLH